MLLLLPTPILRCVLIVNKTEDADEYLVKMVLGCQAYKFPDDVNDVFIDPIP